MESKAERRRVLIVSYYYLPRRMAATYRVKAWAKYFPTYGWEPIILTRHWNPLGGSPWDESMEPQFAERELDSCCWVYRTGYRQARKAAWDWRARLSRAEKGSFLDYSLRKTLSYALKNVLLYPDEFVGWRHEACSVGRSIIRKHNVDAVIATGPPWTDYLVARDLSQEFGLPWVADYRDPWTQPTSLGIPPRFAVYYLVSRFIERSTMRTAGTLIHINEPLAAGLSSMLSCKVRVIPNGYDPEQFDTHRGRVSKKPPFTISFVGTLHADTNPYVFFEGFRMFVSRRNLAPTDCRVSFTGDGFWGVKEEYRQFDEIKSFVSLDAAVPQDQAVERMCSAHVLLLFPLDMDGCTPAKTFEYLASGRPILVTPGGKHRGAIKDILKRAGAGLVVDSAEEVAQWLDMRYGEFQRTGEVSSDADSGYVTRYSRKEQTRQVAEILDALSKVNSTMKGRGTQSS